VNQFDDPDEIAKYLKAHSVETLMGPLSRGEKADLKGFEVGVFPRYVASPEFMF